RLGPRRAPRHQAQALPEQLPQPLRRPFREACGHRHDYPLHRGVGREGPQRPQQHRHAVDRAKLLRLSRPRADPGARGYDHDADVRRRGGGRAHRSRPRRRRPTRARSPASAPTGRHAGTPGGWLLRAVAPRPRPVGPPRPARPRPRTGHRREAAGSATGSSPAPVIANTPISSTDPKRFFTARNSRWSSVLSPSKYSTVSTMCSSVLGPAMPPPFVTWPTSSTAGPASLANRMSRVADSRTWHTFPGAPSSSSVYVA